MKLKNKYEESEECKMLEYEIAKQKYEEMKKKAAVCELEDFNEFYNEFLESATVYANNRASWGHMTFAERAADDKSRTIGHNAFMSMLGAVSRNLQMNEIEEIMPDRKTKGDFACYIALFLALEQR